MLAVFERENGIGSAMYRRLIMVHDDVFSIAGQTRSRGSWLVERLDVQLAYPFGHIRSSTRNCRNLCFGRFFSSSPMRDLSFDEAMEHVFDRVFTVVATTITSILLLAPVPPPPARSKQPLYVQAVQVSLAY